MVAPTPTTIQRELHAALDKVTLSQKKKKEFEFIFSPFFYTYTCTIELQSVGNPLKKMEITTSGKLCTKDNTFVEKKREDTCNLCGIAKAS